MSKAVTVVTLTAAVIQDLLSVKLTTNARNLVIKLYIEIEILEYPTSFQLQYSMPYFKDLRFKHSCLKCEEFSF